MTNDQSPARLGLRKAALVLLVGLTTVIGTAPYVLLVNRLWVLLAFVVGAVVGASIVARRLDSFPGHRPSPLEFALGGIASVTTPAVLGFIGVAVYTLVSDLSALVLLVAPRFGLDLDVSPARLAFWVSFIPAAVLISAGGALAVQRLARQLYPRTAGLQSAFYALVTFRRTQAYLNVGVFVLPLAAGLAIACWVPGFRHHRFFAMALAAALVLVTTRLYKAGAGEYIPKDSKTAIDAVKELFEADGYSVLASPRTGRADVDPLLVRSPHLVAQNADRTFAVQIKTTGDGTEEETASAISDLISASWALGRVLNEDVPDNPQPVEPLLVLVGVEPSVPVRIHERRGDLRVFKISDEKMLQRFAGTEDTEERRQLARDVLSKLPEPASSGRS